MLNSGLRVSYLNFQLEYTCLYHGKDFLSESTCWALQCVGSWVSASVLFLQEWLNIENSSVVWLSLLLWLIMVPPLFDSSAKPPVNDVGVSWCSVSSLSQTGVWVMCTYTSSQGFLPWAAEHISWCLCPKWFPKSTRNSLTPPFPLPPAGRCWRRIVGSPVTVPLFFQQPEHPCHSREHLLASLGGSVQSQLRIPCRSSANCILNMPWHRLPKAAARSMSTCVTIL